MDPHFVCIPRLTALPTGRLACRDLQFFRGQADGPLDAEVLGLGTLEQLLADFFEGRDFAGGERDADFVDCLGRSG